MHNFFNSLVIGLTRLPAKGISMIEPFGYFDILVQTLEFLSLLGLFVLFFLERPTYGRNSLGQESWPMVLLYNFLTMGAYGTYWRLKTTYALYSRDRFTSAQWVFVLLLLFVLQFKLPWFFLGLTIWDFAIRHRLRETADIHMSHFWTLVCGHFYLVSVLEGEHHRLPIDFRNPRPARRKRIVTAYGLLALLVLGVIGVSYWRLVEHRRSEFSGIPAEAVDLSGYWHELHEKYETIYHWDAKGQKNIYTMIKDPHYPQLGYWTRYLLETRIHDGDLYSWNWFTCLRKEQLVAINQGLLTLKNAEATTRVENRIDMETFVEKRKTFLTFGAMERGWELGELLKSPWQCELGYIEEDWNEAWARTVMALLDLLPPSQATSASPDEP
jgi:hypothetical protein